LFRRGGRSLRLEVVKTVLLVCEKEKIAEEKPKTIVTRNKSGQPAAKQAEESSNKETDNVEEEDVMEIIGRSMEERENEIAVQNNKLKAQIKLLEQHVCILSTRSGISSNSSGQNKQIVEQLTDAQKKNLTKWVNSYVWRTNKLALSEHGAWQQPEFERLMFEKLEVHSEAMKIIVRKECYKIRIQAN
jgi:hypothetical protein